MKIQSAGRKANADTQNKKLIMKRSCKHIDIKNYETLIPFVTEAVRRHCDRYDFKNLLMKHGLSQRDYSYFQSTRDPSVLRESIINVAKDCAVRIANRDLKLRPIEIRIKLDKTTGKVREIGKESAMQQCFDYIAYYSANEIFERRIVSEQASSIKHRGQLYGMKMIRGWVVKDLDSSRYAESHGIRYSKKCRYHVKCDIRKCYPSADVEKFIALFSRDCANEDIIWLWYNLLKSHQVGDYKGFMIGSLVSQWACQYMLSFAYRHIKNMHYTKRNKSYQNVSHMLLFMDDQLLIGSNRTQLKKAVAELIRYTHDVLGFEIKESWHIHDINDVPIDMMGFKIYADGHVEIRGRDYIKARRIILRYYSQNYFLTFRQCKRLVSYKGYFKYSNSNNVQKKYNIPRVLKYASQKISEADRRKNVKKECC